MIWLFFVLGEFGALRGEMGFGCLNFRPCRGDVAGGRRDFLRRGLGIDGGFALQQWKEEPAGKAGGVKVLGHPRTG